MSLLATLVRLVRRAARRVEPPLSRAEPDPSCCQPVVRGVRMLQTRQRQQQRREVAGKSRPAEHR